MPFSCAGGLLLSPNELVAGLPSLADPAPTGAANDERLGNPAAAAGWTELRRPLQRMTVHVGILSGPQDTGRLGPYIEDRHTGRTHVSGKEQSLRALCTTNPQFLRVPRRFSQAAVASVRVWACWASSNAVIAVRPLAVTR